MITKRNAFVTILSLILSLSVVTAYADTLFNEDFEGYTSFPDQNPVGDFVNSGIAKRSEGAKETWYGARFETPDNGTIDSDLDVQRTGGGSNSSHVGRVADDAGMLFHISTIGFNNVELDFNYRTFLAESTDKLVVGYYVGNLDFGSCSGNGEAGCYRDFLNQDFGGNSSAAEDWWSNNWTEIVRHQGNSWQSVNNYILPSNQQDIWVAFWLDNGNNDFGKIDNIKVTATMVPEPISSLLFVTGGIALTAMRNRKNKGFTGSQTMAV